MSEELHALITYRLEQAHESLDSAQLLLVHEKYRPSVNRSYYAMFYAILALLALKNFKPSKHSGAISFFNREFVKTGLIDKEFSRWLHEAFDLRQRSDYREMFHISEERTTTVLQHAQAFVAELERKIQVLNSTNHEEQ